MLNLMAVTRERGNESEVGINVMHAKGVDVNLEYAHQWGKRYRSSTGWLKVGYKF